PAAAPAPGHGEEERSIVEGGMRAAEDRGDELSLFKPGDPRGEEPLHRVSFQRPASGAAAVATSAAPPRPAPVAPPAPSGAPAPVKGPYGRVLAVPAARKLARELGIDIEQVVGSGPNGRVRVEDVRAHAEGAAPAAGVAGPARPARPPAVQGDLSALEERVPVRGLRRLISQQMVTSHLQTVRTLHVDEADVSGLVAMRERLKPAAERRGVRLSYLPFVMKAVVAALKEYPALNSSLDEERGEIVVKRYYNIGMAVAVPDGLVVPVVKDVEDLSLLEVAAEVQRLAEAARTGKLAPDDVKGGTFSITNIGSLGGLFSFPIINVPEAAILGLHSIKKRPVVLPDDTIAARSMVYLSLSFDHRVLDGAVAASFTSRLIQLLETPEELMLDL
ncbi:MAG TPA: dihydrolipoamide acetyltransferase family protein, partial [Trueperaceae bacterium]|nr:dihydrolipoamide acetyltransferase family protein [Trueperaceae bacterium]